MSERIQWPIYKGPVKRIVFTKRLYEDPFSIKRHAKTTTPKHAGSDHAYQLYLRHHPYVPKHARPDYRYAKDGTIRKVLPKAETQPIKRKLPHVRQNIPKGPQGPPPPREMLVHVWNDRYEQRFSLEEHRATRRDLTWWERFCLCNYFRELLLLDIIVIMISILCVCSNNSMIQLIGSILLIGSIVLCPIFAVSAIVHHMHKARK